MLKNIAYKKEKLIQIHMNFHQGSTMTFSFFCEFFFVVNKTFIKIFLHFQHNSVVYIKFQYMTIYKIIVSSKSYYIYT